MTSPRKSGFRKLADAAAVVGSLVCVIAAFVAAFFVTAALVAKLPWWAALPIGGVGIIVFFAGSGSLMHQQGSPNSWLTVSASGTLLALSPAFVLLVHGHPAAKFMVPARRGRTIEMDVETLTAFVVPVGLAIAVIGLVVYLLKRARL